MKPRVDAARLKQLLSEYGSLEEAVEAKRKAKSTLEKDVARFQAKRARLEEDKSALEKQLETLASQIAEKNRLLKQIEGMAEQHSWQYKLVTSLVAMLLTSPSREVTLHDLILLLERLERDGWHTIEKPQELRRIFIQVILGFYLRCYQCDNCGVRFILSGLPKDKPVFVSCKCPSCGSTSGVTEAETFLEAMLSPGRGEDLDREQSLQKEIDRLKPLEVFLDLPCGTCAKPMDVTGLTRQQVIQLTRTWHHSNCPEPPEARLNRTLEALIYQKLISNLGGRTG